jgi:hypothetical protein
MYRDKTREIIEFYEDLQDSGANKTDDIKMLVKRNGWIPFRNKATGKFGFFNYKEKIVEDGFSESFFISQAQKFLGNSIPKESINSLIDDSITIFRITHNPFEQRNLYYLSKYDKTSQIYRLNEIRYSKYREQLKDEIGDSTIDLMLRSIRKNDEHWFNGFSLTEIIIAWQTFHNEKIMAIPCIYSKDRGMGKTTWLMVGEYLYDQSGVSHYNTINMGEANANQWGNAEENTRVILYDDVPNDSKTVKELSAKLKANATRAGDKLVNIKGGGMVLSNASNFAVTTNHLQSIPLDEDEDGGSDDDRRLHPIHVKADDYTQEEMNIIKRLDIPMSGQRGKEDKHYPLIQQMLNHLYHVYNKTKDDKEIYYILTKEVPSSKFKSRVAQGSTPTKNLFPVLTNRATSLDELVESLNENFNSNFNFLKDTDYCVVSQIQGKWNLSLKTKGLSALGAILIGQGSTAQQVYNKFFQNSYEFKIQGVGNNKTARCVRFPMKAHK